METFTITGYEQEGNCEHCGRALKHCIRIDDGRIVGATCFSKVMTKPRRSHTGRHYRIGSQDVIRLARNAHLTNEAFARYYGSPALLTFEAA